MSRQELKQRFAEVRESVLRDPVSGGAALQRCADELHAPAPLRNEALVLKLDASLASNPELAAEVQGQLLDLIERISIALPASEDADSTGTVDGSLVSERVQQNYLANPPPNDAVFKGWGIAKHYPRSEFELRGVDLTLRLGEITAVVGQNAHGKTTLLRIVAGELRQSAGLLSYPGIDSSEPIDWVKVKQRVAYLPQQLPPMRGILRDNLHYEAAIHGIVGADNEREVAFVVERLGLGPHLTKAWSELSGGYRLRFSLAKILVWKPQLLVVDEPLANLDVKAQALLLQDLDELAQSLKHPMAILVSSQHLHELEAVATNLIFLREGEVVYNGTVESIGEHRTYNAFEFGTYVDQNKLKELFNAAPYQYLGHDGVSYILRANRGTSGRTVLERILTAGVDIHYFRDISRSAKSLFT